MKATNAHRTAGRWKVFYFSVLCRLIRPGYISHVMIKPIKKIFCQMSHSLPSRAIALGAKTFAPSHTTPFVSWNPSKEKRRQENSGTMCPMLTFSLIIFTCALLSSDHKPYFDFLQVYPPSHHLIYNVHLAIPSYTLRFLIIIRAMREVSRSQ